MLGQNAPPVELASTKIPGWYTKIFHPTEEKDGAYAKLTASSPSTVGLFATAEPPKTPAEPPAPGRGGPSGTITAPLLKRLQATLCDPTTRADAATLLSVDLLSKVLESLEAPPTDSSAAAAANAAIAAAAAAAAAEAKKHKAEGGYDEFDDYYEEEYYSQPSEGGGWNKGTGFGSGTTSSNWNRDQWEAERMARAAHDEAALGCVAKILEIITGTPIDDTIGAGVAKTLSGSALPGLLRELMSTDSMVDIARHRSLYEAAVRVVQAVAQDEKLFKAFEEHERNAAIADALLKTMRSLDRIITQDVDRPVIEAYRRTSGLIKQHRPDAAPPAGDAAVPAVGAPVDYCDFMEPGQFGEAKFETHHYLAQAKSDGPPPATCVERLIQELGSLATSLPLHECSSIFLRYDPERMNLMKALITGPDGTPYSGGCFEFDMYFPHSFPAVPPQVNLMTTGNGAVRFNPNLYNCGKVCLSILGTWPGRPEEMWGPHCTILQVLTSIQSLVLVEEPYFNEPGYESSRGTENGDRRNLDYTMTCQRDCLRWAMLDHLTKPSAAFGKVAAAHFLQRRQALVDQCTKWELAAHAEKHRRETVAVEASNKTAAQYAAEVAAANAAAAAAAAAPDKAHEDKIAAMQELLDEAIADCQKKKHKAKKKAKAKIQSIQLKLDTLKAKPKGGAAGAAAAAATPPPAVQPLPTLAPFVKSEDLLAFEDELNKLEGKGLPSFDDDDGDSDDDEFEDAVEPKSQ